MTDTIQELEAEIFRLSEQLNALKMKQPGTPVENYPFETEQGPRSLLELFGDKDRLLLIHNMGQGCRYCTLWADGLNGFVPHLESALSVALVSRDAPELQRRFAQSRGWHFQLASHGCGDYIREQTVMEGQDNMPGAVTYERQGDIIYRKNSCVFGPNDQYCAIWPLLAMAGLSEAEWTPQYRYWSPPAQMDDGDQDLQD